MISCSFFILTVRCVQALKYLYECNRYLECRSDFSQGYFKTCFLSNEKEDCMYLLILVKVYFWKERHCRHDGDYMFMCYSSNIKAVWSYFFLFDIFFAFSFVCWTVLIYCIEYLFSTYFLSKINLFMNKLSNVSRQIHINSKIMPENMYLRHQVIYSEWRW